MLRDDMISRFINWSIYQLINWVIRRNVKHSLTTPFNVWIHWLSLIYIFQCWIRLETIDEMDHLLTEELQINMQPFWKPINHYCYSGKQNWLKTFVYLLNTVVKVNIFTFGTVGWTKEAIYMAACAKSLCICYTKIYEKIYKRYTKFRIILKLIVRVF